MTTSNRCTEIQGKKPTPLQISMATSNPLYKDSRPEITLSANTQDKK
jgi:hypothetical protein